MGFALNFFIHGSQLNQFNFKSSVNTPDKDPKSRPSSTWSDYKHHKTVEFNNNLINSLY